MAKEKEKVALSVIKYEGGNDVLIWKYPEEDFNIGSQLIVHESQEAIFFRDGKALDTFGAGRHTLETSKLPLLNKITEIPFGGENIFHSEVYFINLVTETGIKWGTDSKVRLFDPNSGLHIEIGASGEFTLRVSNGRKLLLKLVGTTSGINKQDIAGGYQTSQMTGKFKSLVVSKVKALLAKTIKENNINILEIDENIDLLSQALKDAINPTLEDYGLTIPDFWVTNVATPDDDPNFKRLKAQYAEKYLLVKEEEIKKSVAEAEQRRKLVEAETGKKEKIIMAEGEAEAYRLQAEAEAKEMQMKGYTYQQETQRKVGLEAVSHQGSGGTSGGGIASDVVGLGVTLGAVGGVVNMTKEAMQPVFQGGSQLGQGVSGTIQGNWNCSCGQTNITSKFCPNCGQPKPEPKPALGAWDCPNCGAKGNTGKFCQECGTKKPEVKNELAWTCPTCGQVNLSGKFCNNCGTKKPDLNATWDCPNCGAKGNTGKFCNECGTKKEAK